MDCSVLGLQRSNTCMVACSSCNLKQICLPFGLTQSEMERIDGRLVSLRRKVLRGERLFQSGDRFEAVYAVWTGFFKTCVASKDGREQVTGFQMGGEMIGPGRHRRLPPRGGRGGAGGFAGLHDSVQRSGDAGA